MAKSKKGFINVIQEINKRLEEKRKKQGRFWYCYHDEKMEEWGYDLSWNSLEEIDLTKTSYNLDLKVSTYQSRSENVYFYISLFDYSTHKEYTAGYYYIKNYTGLIGKNELIALNDIIEIGTDITNEIYRNY